MIYFSSFLSLRSFCKTIIMTTIIIEIFIIIISIIIMMIKNITIDIIMMLTITKIINTVIKVVESDIQIISAPVQSADSAVTPVTPRPSQLSAAVLRLASRCPQTTTHPRPTARGEV